MLGGMISASPSLSPGQVAGRSLDTVCFFVLCKRHWINRVPGAHQGFPVYSLHLNSDAGYAVLPLTLLGVTMYVYYCRTYEKAVSWGRQREIGGHVLRDTTSRGLCVRVWPPHTSERRGGGGGCDTRPGPGASQRPRPHFGLWRVCFPPVLCRTVTAARRLPSEVPLPSFLSFGLWRVRFTPVLVRTARRLPWRH